MADFVTPVKSNKIKEGNDKLCIPPSPFLNRLGYGTGVSVMQLVRSPKAGQIRSPWALKMINKRVKPNRIYTERLQAEANLLQRMSHPNIVGFRAFDKSKILYLGMEACDVSLGDMIEKKTENGCKPFEPTYILKVASDIGNALDYLHTRMHILHGDMKSYNILVNGNFIICKLCDFGVSLPLDDNGTIKKENPGNSVYYGTEAWSAPEVIHGGIISSKTDIWPLGLVFWEMLALMPPHTQMDDDTLDVSVDSLEDDSMMDYFSNRYGTRPVVPANICPVRYEQPLALFCSCTELQPASRPSARLVADTSAFALPQNTYNP